MSTVGNWIGEITTTIGTGSIELGGPINPSFVKFSDAVVDLSEVWYAIVDGDNRESGLGTLNGTNLERTVVHTTLVDGVYLGNTPDPISLSGGAQIYSTFNKAAFDIFYNALVTNAGDISDLQSAVIALQAANLLKENSLGNPAGDGYILSSTTSGVRSWVPTSDADMVSSVYDPTGIYGDAFNRINHHGLQAMSTISGLSDALDGKVDAVPGKGLSTEDYTTEEKAKLGDIDPAKYQPKVVAVTVTTAASNAAKTATVEGYEPAPGDLILLTLELGSSSSTMTLSINSGTAFPVLVGATPTLTFFIPNVLNCKVLLIFDGAAYYAHSLMNTNYIVIPESELIAGTGTTARTITAARLRYAFDNLLATIARSGSMSYLDKQKLDGIEANAEMNAVTSVNGQTGAVELYQTATTGTLISFAAPKVFGSVATPETGNIDNDLTAAKPGIVQKIYHSHSTAPTFPAGWVKLGSGTYTTGALNIIYCDFAGGSRVEYWVTQ